MKKIIPFNNVLEFSTDIAKITAISLEHEIKKDEGSICGEFFINGEYKVTDGQLTDDKFNFELPFDIALGCNYELSSLVIDIDDFRYEVVGRNKLKVNIDLYIDGKELEERKDEKIMEEEIIEEETKEELVVDRPVIDKIDIVQNITDSEVDVQADNEIDNNNIFQGFNEEEKYVTYRVYRVSEGDTLDKIMEKYNVSREEMDKYNNTLDIKPGDKLIIPAND